MPLDVSIQFILALIFGGLVGLERESKTTGKYLGSLGGVRTYSLISLLGALSGLFYLKGFVSIALILIITLLVFLLCYYLISNRTTDQHSGITTEISAIYTFLIGLLITLNIIPMQLVIALLVVLILVLSMKSRTHKWALGISNTELESFITYAIIALVILPFLPNKSYYLTDVPGLANVLAFYKLHLGSFAQLEILNPYRLWLIVALITGIDIFGYILAKIFGNKKGVILTSFIGGIVSSTSTTQSLAQRSSRSKVVNRLVGAAIISGTASFFTVFLFVGPINSDWLTYITPTLLLMIVVGTIVGTFYLNQKEKIAKDKKQDSKGSKIFSLDSAIKFALLLISVRIITKTALVFFGQSGFLLSSMIASFAGLDAIIINLAELAGKTITFESALLTLAAVNATNLLAKTIYAYMQGKREFANKFLISSIIIAASAFAGYFLL